MSLDPVEKIPKRKLRVEYNRKNCIGAGTCSLSDPESFKLDTDGLAVLTDSSYDEKKGVWTRIYETENSHMPYNAAVHCPTKVITVYNAETGDVIAPEFRQRQQKMEREKKGEVTKVGTSILNPAERLAVAAAAEVKDTTEPASEGVKKKLAEPIQIKPEVAREQPEEKQGVIGKILGRKKKKEKAAGSFSLATGSIEASKQDRE